MEGNSTKSLAPNRVMIITGASSGIGAAVARRMAREKYCLLLAARREDRLESVSRDICKTGGEAIVIPTDVTRHEDLERMLMVALNHWGRVDILFNNAGVSYDDALVQMTPEEIQQEIHTNLTAVIESTRVALPTMLRQKSGHVINTASIGGLIATPNASIYSATKFGVVGFSDALRRELRGTGVHVSAFCPGYTPSELTPSLKAQYEGREGARSQPGIMPNTYVADQVADLIRRPRRMLLIPKLWRPLILFGTLFPAATDALLKYFS